MNGNFHISPQALPQYTSSGQPAPLRLALRPVASSEVIDTRDENSAEWIPKGNHSVPLESGGKGVRGRPWPGNLMNSTSALSCRLDATTDSMGVRVASAEYAAASHPVVKYSYCKRFTRYPVRYLAAHESNPPPEHS